MAEASTTGSGWQIPSSAIRVRLELQPDLPPVCALTARAAFGTAAGAGTRLVELEQSADLLLAVGTAEWAAGFIQQFRRAGATKPIVVLNSDAENRANAPILDAGADDCLACPFESVELLARVRAVARRSRKGISSDLEIAVDCETCRVRLRDIEAQVSPRQFAIFMCLAEQRERWVHSDEIILAVCGTHHKPDTSLVRVQIHALRKALGPMRECIRCDGHKRYMLTLANRTDLAATHERR